MLRPDDPDEHAKGAGPAQTCLNPPVHPNARPGYLAGDNPDLDVSVRIAQQSTPACHDHPVGQERATKQSIIQVLVEPEAFNLPLGSLQQIVLEPHDEAPTTPYDQVEDKDKRSLFVKISE